MRARWTRHLHRILHSAADATPIRFRDAGIAVVWGGMLYGAVMGTFGGLSTDRWLQIVFSSIKVPMLIAVTGLLAMPSFFVLNTIAGLRSDFLEAMKAIAISQSIVGVVLASLAPLTIVWYCSNANYHQATIFNGLMFAMASFASHSVIRRRYAPLIARNPRHRQMLIIWIVIFVFVGIQMGWILRPFIGDPLTPPSFYRKETFGNAYVIVADLILRQLSAI
jgi:hypothetical protein